MMNDHIIENNLSKYSDCSLENFYFKYKKAMNSLTKSNQKFLNIEQRNSKLVDIFNNIDEEITILYRKNDTADDLKICNWVSSLRYKADIVQSYNKVEYKGITKKDISSLIKLSKNPERILSIPKILLSYGIILVYENYISGMKLDGVLYKNRFGVPVIGISFRYKRIDSFWFTLIHELCHILLHYDLIDSIIFENFENENENKIEIEANRLTRDLLIPKQAWRSSDTRINKSKESVLFLAKRLEIHPAIIAGRIRFDNKNYTLLNEIESKIQIEGI